MWCVRTTFVRDAVFQFLQFHKHNCLMPQCTEHTVPTTFPTKVQTSHTYMTLPGPQGFHTSDEISIDSWIVRNCNTQYLICNPLPPQKNPVQKAERTEQREARRNSTDSQVSVTLSSHLVPITLVLFLNLYRQWKRFLIHLGFKKCVGLKSGWNCECARVVNMPKLALVHAGMLIA